MEWRELDMKTSAHILPQGGQGDIRTLQESKLDHSRSAMRGSPTILFALKMLSNMGVEAWRHEINKV